MTKPMIVCVDDDPAILTLVARVLSEYDVRTTELATQALRWVTQGEVAVVVSDYDMPDMTRKGDVHVAGDMKVAWFKDPDGNILNIASG